MADVHRLGGDPPTQWETEFGYSRVVVAGGLAMVGGTTSAGPAGAVLGETPYEQAREVLRRILHEFSRAGVMPDDVVSLRVYVTDISRAEEVGRAFSEALGSVGPLMTMVEVSSLIDPRMWVEIEAVAVAPNAPGAPLR
jgi:enamine deaminase RidA (YjgF/YER057c/UK114 family)